MRKILNSIRIGISLLKEVCSSFLYTKPGSFMLLFMGLLTFSSAFAQSNSNCGAGQTIVWSENQTITGTFVVAPDDVLVILPGVKVEFQTAASGLQILGTIDAQGSTQNPIVFEGAGGAFWSGVDLTDACPSVFQHCRFTGIKRAAAKSNSLRATGGFNISTTNNVSFSNCVFNLNFDGIEITGSTNVSFTNCTFQNNEIAFADNGLIYLLGSSEILIKGNNFYQNKVSTKGILNVNDGSNANITQNTFSNTTFAGALFFGTIYPVILARASNLNTFAVINGNSFLNNRAPANQKLAEVQITGKDNSIDQLTALIWNNTFLGYPFPLPNSTPKSAVRVNSAVVTITNNTFRYYNDYGVRILKSEAKINLNYFENNKGTTGALSFDNYSTYSGRAVENVVFANVFDNNRAPNGAAISLLNTPGSLVRTSILQNIFQDNKSDNNGGALNAMDVSNVVIEDNSFYNNSAVNGGAVYLRGISAMREKIAISTSSIAFTDNIFSGNESIEKGGGAFMENAAELTLTRNLFNDNSGNGGSGLYILNSNIDLYNCNFIANQGLANGGGLFLEVNEANQITIQNCNFANHANAGGIAIVNNIQPSGINIFNTLFYGNNTGTTGKAIVFSSTQNVITNNCYFDVIPTGFSVSNNNPQQSPWPGWLGAANFYLDCLNSVCVDNGNPDAVFNDREDGQTGQALFPSCGTLTNDIGISGGPFAANRIWLFQPNPANAANILADSQLKNQIAPDNFLQTSQTDVAFGNLQIYPNPSSGYISISNLEGLEGDYNLILINNSGVKVTELKVQIAATDESMHFDFSTLSKGIYFMMLTNQNQLITKKIILN